MATLILRKVSPNPSATGYKRLPCGGRNLVSLIANAMKFDE